MIMKEIKKIKTDRLFWGVMTILFTISFHSPRIVSIDCGVERMIISVGAFVGLMFSLYYFLVKSIGEIEEETEQD